MNEVDIVVIGAGQAGLATSHALIDSGLSHVVLDDGDEFDRMLTDIRKNTPDRPPFEFD